MPDLEPITREEMLLDGEDLTPITRKEKFIKRIYDKTQEIPEPVTREEMFLKKAGEGGGGDIDLQTLNVTENGTVNAPSGVAYNKVVTNVPSVIPENAYLLEEYEDVPTDIASFTASDAPLKSLTASIVPVQAGSGDPSPTNVRPISGWTEEVITVADDLQNPTVTHTTAIPFTDGQGQSVEVFGGSVDVVNGGEQQRTFGEIIFDGSSDENWLSYAYGYYIYCGDMKSGTDLDGLCNMLTKQTSVSRLGFKLGSDNKFIYINQVQNEWGISDVSELRSFLSEKNLQFTYPLATPTTFYTQPTSIKSLDGVNNVYASTGDVTELKYFAKEVTP